MVLAAVGQICSTTSFSHNLAQCRSLVQKAATAGAKALFLPEASDYIATSPDESVSLCKPIHKSPFVLGLQEDAKKYSLPISVGIHEPSDDPKSKRLKNTLIWIDQNGEISPRYRYQKLHLFDLELEGKPPLKESNSTEPGSAILPPFESPVGQIGAAICFDLRFPEVALSLKRQGAEIILYPSAFHPSTGAAHWHSLLRCRAIENECYVIAAAQVGSHNDKRISYGHSIAINPWGEIIAELGGEKGDEPEIALADIDLEKLTSVRSQLPLKRRT
ncbi:nitrilase-like protein [Polychaeton citri CBS 116435]|uniref:Nitrilase-like protein n=1 Tax=Polychaeton citri CBS 116435 TaxID=1314669 RepID=A0A9P4UNX4_9PEZI|nr:nitrilase-like protein [Polychaeton citri CBS 116435]